MSGRDSFPGSERTLKLKDYEIDKKSVTAKFPDLPNSKTDQLQNWPTQTDNEIQNFKYFCVYFDKQHEML